MIDWASFLVSGELQIDMPNVRCLEDHDSVARRSTLVVSLKDVNEFSNCVDSYTDLDKSYNMMPFLVNFGRWGRELNFKRQM